ncbi:hypothetical protein Cal6303_5599 [Calothrix sp. PCC 6303]|nr:hypothetical protein Cal6303_5599 [Calothrix sp. PCC 6303]
MPISTSVLIKVVVNFASPALSQNFQVSRIKQMLLVGDA